MIVTETKRLILKQFSEEDAEGFYLMNLDKEVLRFTGDKPFSSVEETRAFINAYQEYEKNGFGRWSLYLKENNRYIGFSGLRRSSDTDLVDIGFRIVRDYWNQGVATESANACLELAFDRYKVDKVVARAMINNKASLAVIKKLGMRFQNDFIEGTQVWKQFELTRQLWSKRLAQ
ncbi:GNAT family N-acetyltransferase [Aliikangiella sp. G2MR2-5]|uniref:GNAT family N-acetyltransferase n=1 Tax=Aliikangiella sp. G2MR2-5 TaxID=2788943 RepID=UPI0018A9B477|nr:GNAT family N-acetyltransferase [Aliikangiella sp. G2MR2-5]